jgi:hypothetical protein
MESNREERRRRTSRRDDGRQLVCFFGFWVVCLFAAVDRIGEEGRRGLLPSRFYRAEPGEELRRLGGGGGGVVI